MLGACTINKRVEDEPPHKDWLTRLVTIFDYGFTTSKRLIKNHVLSVTNCYTHA